MTELKGHLTLIGDSFDVDSIASVLNCSPTWIMKKGAAKKNGNLYDHCEWGVETQLFCSEIFSDVEKSVMNLIPCSQNDLAQIACDCNAVWNILFYIRVEEDFPAVVLSQEFLKFSAEIGAEVGFDVCLIGP